MKKHQKHLGVRRFSASPALNFPPLTHTRKDSVDQTSLNYNSGFKSATAKPVTTCHKFFTLKPPGLSQSPNTDISTCRSAFTSQDLYTPAKGFFYSDITERIDLYELKTVQKFDIEILQENFYLWEKCFAEIAIEIKKQDSDLGTGMVKLCSHYSKIVKDFLRMAYMKKKEDKVWQDEMKKKVMEIESENKKLGEEIEELRKEKKFEKDLIDKEIEEIFGKDEAEIRLLQIASKEYSEKMNKTTVEYLTEIWNSMNHEFDVPEIRNGAFLGMDPSEIPELLAKKFHMVHHFTTKRITELIKSRKNIRNKEMQTVVEYINPQLYEDRGKTIEKLQIQLQNALVSIEKFRENYGSKVNIVETLENEKNLIAIELERFKKECDSIKQSLDKANFELQKTSFSLTNAKNEKEILTSERHAFISNLAEKEKKLQEISQLSEKQDKMLKDKDERINKLEKAAAKRKQGKAPVEEKESAVKPRASMNTDEKEFLNNIKSKKRNTQAVISTYDSPTKPNDNALEDSKLGSGSKTRKSKPSNSLAPIDTSRPSDTGNPDLRSPRSGKMSSPRRTSGIDNTSQKRDSEAEKSPSKTRGNLPQINEVHSPSHKGGQRDSNLLIEISESNSPRNYSRHDRTQDESDDQKVLERKSREKKSREKKSRENKSGEKKSREKKSGEKESRERKSGEKSRRTQRSKKSNFLGQTIDNEDYSDSKSASDNDYGNIPTMSYLKKPKKSYKSNSSERSYDSSASDKSESFESNQTRKSKKVRMAEEGTGTLDLSYLKTLEFSKAVQYNHLLPDSEEPAEPNNRVYMLPYNPNQHFGLRGDSYYHSKNSVFQAQPRIPDLKESMFFRSPFNLKSN